MDAELKARWAAALRSGEYIQARNALKNRIGYCCLGVLCKVAPDAIPARIEEGANELVLFWGEGDDERAEGTELPCHVRRAIGLSTGNAQNLMAMNDGREGHDFHTFTEIADWIEESL